MPTTKDRTVLETLENKIATIIHHQNQRESKASFNRNEKNSEMKEFLIISSMQFQQKKKKKKHSRNQQQQTK